MAQQQDVLKFQAEHHPMEGTGRFETEEAYCLYLMHLRVYEEIASLGEGKAVLDLGCNNGWGTLVLARNARRVVGVDVSEAALHEARNSGAGTNVEFVKVDGERLPFAHGEFDLVASCQVIEHVADYGPYLGEILRVLSPNGIAVFTTPNARIRLDPGMKPWFPYHVREFSGDELHELLKHWFSDVVVRGLFATPDAYNVEYRRVQRGRERARNRARAVLPPFNDIKTRAIVGIKSVLPDRIVKTVQSVVRRLEGRDESTGERVKAERPRLDAAVLDRYSTQDFHYTADNIDAALDLIAVCRKSAQVGAK